MSACVRRAPQQSAQTSPSHSTPVERTYAQASSGSPSLAHLFFPAHQYIFLLRDGTECRRISDRWAPAHRSTSLHLTQASASLPSQPARFRPSRLPPRHPSSHRLAAPGGRIFSRANGPLLDAHGLAATSPAMASGWKRNGPGARRDRTTRPCGRRPLRGPGQTDPARELARLAVFVENQTAEGAVEPSREVVLAPTRVRRSRSRLGSCGARTPSEIAPDHPP